MELTKEELEEARRIVEGPDPLDEALLAEGITTEYLARKLKEELEAEKTEFAKEGGRITDERDVVDWSTRQRARIDAHKLKGHYPAEKVDVRGGLDVGGRWTVEVVDPKDTGEDNEGT